MNRVRTISLCLALLASACGQVVNVSACEERCEMQNEAACLGTALDCEALCDHAADLASTSACAVEFNASQRCLIDNNSCDTSPCAAEVDAFVTCFTTFCDANPDSGVCPTEP